MTLAMGANLLYRTAYMNAAVTINHEMITDAEKNTLRMLQGFWENLFFLAEMHG